MLKLPELWIGGGGILAALTVNEWAALAVAAVTIFALLPLGLMRWRALFRGQPPIKKEP